jgi:hypothetical protein
MIYVTQLIYVHPGKETEFETFESAVLPLLARYRGELLLRLRPNPASVVACSRESPYEVHLVSFETEDDLERYSRDDQRQRFLHLKNESVRSALVVRGTALS